MENQVIDTIMARRSVRSYLPEQVDEALLSAVLEAGRAAPSGGNNQTTHLIVIQNDTVKEELARIAKSEFAKMIPDESMYFNLRGAIEKSKREDADFNFYYSAPTLIVTANKNGYTNALVDSACVLENMMIAAVSLGLGSCWMNPLHWLDENEALRAYMYTLGLKEDETITGGLALGIPAQPAPPPLPRKGNPVTFVR